MSQNERELQFLFFVYFQFFVFFLFEDFRDIIGCRCANDFADAQVRWILSGPRGVQRHLDFFFTHCVFVLSFSVCCRCHENLRKTCVRRKAARDTRECQERKYQRLMRSAHSSSQTHSRNMQRMTIFLITTLSHSIYLIDNTKCPRNQTTNFQSRSWIQKR